MPLTGKPSPNRSRSKRVVKARSKPLRILTAVPTCDGHDSPIITINLELVRHGIEVIYLGYHRSAQDIARAAIQEDVQAIGISSYNGGHVEFFAEVLALLRQKGAPHIGVFGGGGGTITPADIRIMKQRGVKEIFGAGTSLDHIVQFVTNTYANSHRRTLFRLPQKNRRGLDPFLRGASDCVLSHTLTRASTARTSLSRPAERRSLGKGRTPVLGLTGPGGAGKTTLIDELVLRFLKSRPQGRLAILSHDPSLPAKGALLGDRAAMGYAHNDRVFMRSLSTGGHSGGLSPVTRASCEALRRSGFDFVLVESAGIGQEDLPFANRLVDRQVLVMSPEYGSRLQLQKIVMLEVADVIVLNKADYPGARTAASELEQRIALNGKGQKLIRAVAKRHRDAGVDELFEELFK